MGAAVFERFPNIRVVLGESGIGWIPDVIDRMDFEYRTVSGPEAQAAAERILAAPVQGDVPV